MEFTRRQFLVGSAATLSQGAQAMIPDVSGPFIDRLATLSWEEEVRQLAPRPDIGLNASYKIPGAEIARLYGAQIIPLHMKHLFLEGFNKGTKIVAGHSPDLYFDYLRGVNDAGRRGQPTTMVLEMPVDHSVGQEEWQKYLEWLVPQIQASHIVIGNEMWGTELVGGRMNGSRSNWGTHWDQYARLFGMAHDVIRKLSPETRVILTAPHYFGDNGEIMANQLYAINQLNQERQKLGQALIGIDGAALHFYDIAHKMPAYVLGQRKVLNDYGYDVPVYITEHGVNENEGGSTGYDRRVQAQYASGRRGDAIGTGKPKRMETQHLGGGLAAMRRARDAKQNLATGHECRDSGLAVGIGFFTQSQHGGQNGRAGMRADIRLVRAVLLECMRKGSIGQRRVRCMHARIRGAHDGANATAAIAARIIRDDAAPRKLRAERGDRHGIDDTVLGPFHDVGRNLRKLELGCEFCQNLRGCRHEISSPMLNDPRQSRGLIE